MSSKVKVCIVNSESRADHKVYIVDSDSRQKNHQLIAGGELVQSESRADLKVCLINSESRATIKITQKNFPK